MQRLFAEGGPWPTLWMPRVLPTVERLARRAPERTIFTRFIPPIAPAQAHGVWQEYYAKWPHVTRGTMDLAWLRLVPELEALAPPAVVIDKPVYSALSTGMLRAYLQENMSIPSLSPVLDAVDFGYRVIVVKDGLCSSSDEAHEASMKLYTQRFDIQIELALALEILEIWRP
jgi:nicotinamidase-related amidase